MFDIGFTELLLVGLVALVVLGPERLPGAVRTTGLWVGRLKRSFSNIKAEVEREIGADEIRRQLHNERILDLEKEMKATRRSAHDRIVGRPLEAQLQQHQGRGRAGNRRGRNSSSAAQRAHSRPRKGNEDDEGKHHAALVLILQ